jgi:hypothetical protein
MRRLAVYFLALGAFLGNSHMASADPPYTPGNLLVARFPLFQIVSGSHTIWSDGITIGLLYPSDFNLVAAFVTPSESSRTFSWSDTTPGFGPIAARMTDGQNEEIDVFQTGGWGGNAESAWLTGIFGSSLSTNGVDLQGFIVSRIDMRVDFLRLTSPGRDLFGDGQWTDVDFSGEFLIYGDAVPEPAASSLWAMSSLVLALRSRRTTPSV